MYTLSEGDAGRYGRSDMPTYLYWRGRSLWTRWPKRMPLDIHRTGDGRAETARCVRLGEQALAKLRVEVVEGKFFDKAAETEEAPYRPRFWRLVGRYWYHHLRFQKSGANERYHLAHSLREFGGQPAHEIEAVDVQRWMRRQRQKGVAVNTVNRRLAYMKRAFSYAKAEASPRHRLDYDPSAGVHALSGGNVRQYLLTPERFERHYEFLREASPRFALFYLGLWETGRRPLEVASYMWEMLDMEDQGLEIPASITKGKEPAWIPVSDRLFVELVSIPEAERTGTIFKNHRGRPWLWEARPGVVRNSCHRHMSKLRERFPGAGWARDARGGFVTRHADAADLSTLMSLSGHRDVRSVQRYMKYRRDRMREVVGSKVEAGPKLKVVSAQ